jgi:hypothetical protein
MAGSCLAGTPLDCDDGNACTADTCNPLTGCQNTPVVDGTPCPDATICNGDEICAGGVCSAGTPLNCDDGNACTIDVCDPVLGCQYANQPDGSSCADATLCNGDETCVLGVCTPGTPLDCDDLNPCTADSCDPILGCQNPALPDGTSCGVGLTCSNGVCL